MNTDLTLPDLLDQFLRYDCTEYARTVLEEAINDTSKVRAHLDFNRFAVTIERENNIVVLQDDLDVSEAGTLRMPIAEFANALKHRTAVSGAMR
jgi:hypothetical protein